MADVDDPDGLLAAYDEQLRTDAETPGAVAVAALGPLRLAVSVDQTSCRSSFWDHAP